MKATLEFNLPEENPEFDLAMNGPKYHSALWDIENKLRQWVKYETAPESVEMLIEEIRWMIPDLSQ